MNFCTSGVGDFEPAKRWVILTRKMTVGDNDLASIFSECKSAARAVNKSKKVF